MFCFSDYRVRRRYARARIGCRVRRVTTPGVEADLGWALSAITRSYLRAARDAVADLPGGARGYLVLAVAGQGEPRSQLALAQHLGVDRTAMTYLLDDLEAAGLVERRPDPTDRRARRVAPTPDGLALLCEVKATLRDVEDALLAPLDDQERVVLRGLLRRLATNVAPANPCEIAREFAESGPASRARPRRHTARAVVGSPDGTTTV
jgi:DNA-binding MarR family transcriptional regulator